MKKGVLRVAHPHTFQCDCPLLILTPDYYLLTMVPQPQIAASIHPIQLFYNNMIILQFKRQTCLCISMQTSSANIPQWGTDSGVLASEYRSTWYSAGVMKPRPRLVTGTLAGTADCSSRCSQTPGQSSNQRRRHPVEIKENTIVRWDYIYC